MGGGIAAGYDRSAAGYDDAARHNAMAGERLCAALPLERAESLLDIGCGTGFATIAMRRRFPGLRSVTGVDISPGMLARFRDKLAAEEDLEVRALVADVPADPLPPGPYDVVLSSMVLHWIEDRGALLSAAVGALRPGGVIGLVAPGTDHDIEFVELLRGLRPAVPARMHEIFGANELDPGRLQEALREAGAEPVDVWLERRVRRVPPESYLARISTVGNHVWAALMEPGELRETMGRIERALRAASGPRGWEYTFTKTFAVARRP